MTDCPLCKGKTPNATTIAAMEECRAIQRERRLQSLRDEFEAARDRLLSSEVRIMSVDPASTKDDIIVVREVKTVRAIYPHVEHWTPDTWSEEGPLAPIRQNCEAVRDAARRYIIARDFEEFREEKWQLIWKLRKL